MIGTLLTVATEVVASQGVSKVMYQIVKATGPRYVSKATRMWTKVGITAISTAVSAAAAKEVGDTIEDVKSLKDELKLRGSVLNYGHKEKG